MSDETTDEVEEPEWTENHWIATNTGRILILFDIVLSVAIASYMIGAVNPNVPIIGSEVINPRFELTRLNVLLFTMLGTLAYIFTPLYKDIHRSTGDVLEYNFRIVGAIPLAFGIFLLSEYIVPQGQTGILTLSFIAGLYINTFYKRIGVIADNLLPAEEDQDTEENQDTAESDSEPQ